LKKKLKADFSLLSTAPFKAGTCRAIKFSYIPNRPMPPNSRVWIFLDVRQDCGVPQSMDSTTINYINAKATNNRLITCKSYFARTLDFFPRIPEFLHTIEIIFREGLEAIDEVEINLGNHDLGWQLPIRKIDPFHFWLVESEEDSWRFMTNWERGYKTFSQGGKRLSIPDSIIKTSISVEGNLPRLSKRNKRRTPGILWGEIHGMAFNQRPLDDYYNFARNIAKFDFASPLLFSYNTCVKGVWQEVKDAAARWTEPGRFLGITGVELDTIPDGSHRKVHFFDDIDVPPIFCENRPPAHDPRLLARFSNDTIYCNTLDQFYDVVKQYDGILSGHHHTITYDREILAEIWQKQSTPPNGDEQRIFQLLDDGLKLGIVAGSDTHDSLPGNPYSEYGSPSQTAGFMAVLANEISPDAIKNAIISRQVYATTGAKIELNFSCDGAPMGSCLQHQNRRDFQIQIEGSSKLKKVELIRKSKIVCTKTLSGLTANISFSDCDVSLKENDWYIVKVYQSDNHRAWSSPIWFE
jgi:hypothetical protein